MTAIKSRTGRARRIGGVASTFSTDYPVWTPQELCKFHALCVVTKRIDEEWLWPSGKLDEAQAIAIFGALLTDDRMKSVWKALRRRSEKLEVQDWPRKFVRHCLGTIARYNAAPKMTPAETRKHLTKIASLARALGAAMENSPSRDIRDVHISELLDSYGIGHVSTAEERALPSVRELVMRLAKMLALNARRRDSFFDIPQPNARDAREHFFIRALSSYFRNVYGLPLHDHVRTITEVAFGRSPGTIRPGTVRLLLARDRRKNAPPTQE